MVTPALVAQATASFLVDTGTDLTVQLARSASGFPSFATAFAIDHWQTHRDRGKPGCAGTAGARPNWTMDGIMPPHESWRE
jgi:hypothetical protein